MHPLKRLQKLFAPPAPSTSGQIVSIQADSITVATAQGSKTVQRLPGDATGYKPGDKVRLAGANVIGRQRPAGDVYSV